jgi:hypothetical protein
MSTTRKCDMCTTEDSNFDGWGHLVINGKLFVSRDLCPKCSAQILAIVEHKDVGIVAAALR